MCINQVVNCTCGFTGGDPNFVVPIWRIIKRRNGVVVSNEAINGRDIIDTTDGLEWIPDLLNGNNSVLRVGPVNRTDNQSSYQCIFAPVKGENSIESSIGTLTAIGKINNHDEDTDMCLSIHSPGIQLLFYIVYIGAQIVVLVQLYISTRSVMSMQ